MGFCWWIQNKIKLKLRNKTEKIHSNAVLCCFFNKPKQKNYLSSFPLKNFFVQWKSFVYGKFHVIFFSSTSIRFSFALGFLFPNRFSVVSISRKKTEISFQMVFWSENNPNWDERREKEKTISSNSQFEWDRVSARTNFFFSLCCFAFVSDLFNLYFLCYRTRWKSLRFDLYCWILWPNLVEMMKKNRNKMIFAYKQTVTTTQAQQVFFSTRFDKFCLSRGRAEQSRALLNKCSNKIEKRHHSWELK